MPTRRIYPYVPIELAAVCSAAFILLLLYLSEARAKFPEPLNIQMPASTGFVCNIDGFGDGMVLVGQGKVMLDFEGEIWKQTLINMGKKYNMRFTLAEQETFETMNIIGVPLSQLKSYLATYKPESKAYYSQQGISIETSKNELGDWISSAKQAQRAMKNSAIRMALMADSSTNSLLIKRVMDILVERKIHSVNLVTDTKRWERQ
jgi:biopolymer transport protein ExbD